MKQRGLDVSYDVLCAITRIRGSGIFLVLTGKLNFYKKELQQRAPESGSGELCN